jgi:hypothetical protein
MAWKPAIVASGVIALALTIFHQLYATGGSVHFRLVDWEVVNELSYKQAQEYLLERSKKLSKSESLANAVQYGHFWTTALMELVFLWILGLRSCRLYEKLKTST